MRTSLLLMPSWLSWTLSIIVAVLVLLVMITVHELGHYIAGRIFKFKINEFAIGFGKPIFRRVGKSGRAFSIRIVPLGGYCAFEGEDSDTPVEGAFNNQKPWKRLIVLFAGAFMNFIFSLIVILTAFLCYGQFMTKVNTVYQAENVENPAHVFMQDDIIVSVNGRDIYLNTDIAAAIKNVSVNELVECDVIRDGERQTISALYRKYEYRLPSEEGGEGELVSNVGFGISIGSVNHKFGFFESIGRSFVYIFRMFVETLKLPAKLITGLVGINDIGGPITTIGMTAQFAQMGFNYLLEMVAMIGISLSVFNLFPIPALDGARMVFTTIEWIRGKPINRKVEGYIHAVGLMLLFALILVVDILHFV